MNAVDRLRKLVNDTEKWLGTAEWLPFERAVEWSTSMDRQRSIGIHYDLCRVWSFPTVEKDPREYLVPRR